MAVFASVFTILAGLAQPVNAKTTNDRWPHYSPDGKLIAFTSDRDGSFRVYVMHADGTKLHVATNAAKSPMQFLAASWFPNGDLLYVGVQPSAIDGSDNSLDAESFIESDAAGQHRHIVYQGINDERPQVSPNGASIVFEAERGTFNSTPAIDIQVLDIATLTTRTLTHADGQYVQAAWSPDGSKIAYGCGKVKDKELQICVMDADGSNDRTVTRGAGSHQWPSWSPDSKRLAYFVETYHAGVLDSSIGIVGSDGNSQLLISHHENVLRDETPSWSPDGQHIACQTDRFGPGFRIAVMNADGTDLQMLTK